MRITDSAKLVTAAALSAATIGIVAWWEAPPQATTTVAAQRSEPGAAANEPFRQLPGVRDTGPIAAAGAPLTPSERELLDWAIERFAVVGLTLPDVEISFHDDTESCGGHPGRFRGDRWHRRIVVCVPDTGTFASHLERQRTLVHELAHAWDHANLDRHKRADLLGILDASEWYAPESDWEERGVERFAETIVWGLYDQLRRPVLIDVPCWELHADFQAITGFATPGPLEPVCTPVSVPSGCREPRSEGGTGSRTLRRCNHVAVVGAGETAGDRESDAPAGADRPTVDH